MKYIRTSKSVYKVCWEELEYTGKPFRTTSMKESELVLKESNTIEELCDVYVMNHGFGPYLVYIDELDGHAMGQTKEMLLSGQLEAYGAIWVFDSNGAPTLKPVAKMNNEGELELL